MARRSDNLIENLLLVAGLGFLGVRYVLPMIGVSVTLPGMPSAGGGSSPALPAPGGSGPRGIRNNNPGNIRWSVVNPWAGQTGKDAAGYAIFSSPLYGLRAAFKLLRNYRTFYGADTIAKIGSRWAPSSENNTAAWSANVANMSGIAQNAALDASNAAQMTALLRGVIGAENGSGYVNHYSAALMSQAWGMT